MLSREEQDITTYGEEQRQDGGVTGEQPWSGGAAVIKLPKCLECLTEAQTAVMRHTLGKYANAFRQEDMDLGHTSLVRHTIDTGDIRPLKQPPRRVAPAKREEMQRVVHEIAALGLIEKSDNPWLSPVVLVTKKDGSIRFCVDYRAFNQMTVKDSYPLPRIDDMLDALEGVQWFPTLDLKSGYHHVEMAEEGKK